ncbi:protein of unknown function [Ruminococcaceae bacterium BL-6]|nr:protein of unknown function [Ruminococcaceae bacterium BL-6]
MVMIPTDVYPSLYFDLRKLDGTKVHTSASYKKLRLLEKSNGQIIERRMAIPPLP